MTPRPRKKARTLIWPLLAAAASLAPPAFAAGDTIVPYSAQYKIKISIASGTLETVVREAEESFSVRSVIKPSGFARILMKGTIEESSRFEIDDDGVRPLVYASTDTLSREDKVMNFVFDWEANSVSGTVNDETYSFSLDEDVHDRVSIQYQLMHNLLTGASASEYAMLDGDELKELQITTIGIREIKVPFGTFEAIGIRHQAADSKRITTLWCAEELGYLPVLIEQHRKGKRRVHAVLTKYTPGMQGEKTISASN